MSSIEDISGHTIPIENLPSFAFKFGTTIQEKDDCFDSIGRILMIILDSKLNENYYNILYRLKPIVGIDEYMLKFNFDKEVALRQNSDLEKTIHFWFEDSAELMAESKQALSSVLKVEQFVKLLEKQEQEFKSSIFRNLQVNRYNANRQSVEEHHIDNILAVPGTVIKNSEKSNESSEVKSEFKIVLKVNGEPKHYTLEKALEVIKETKELYERQYSATEALHNCIDVLNAINLSNRTEISHWKLSETAIKMRSNLWNKRKSEHKLNDKQNSSQHSIN